MVSNETLEDERPADRQVCGAPGSHKPPQARASQMLDYGEAAEFLGVKVATLYSMVSRGEIPYARIGKRMGASGSP